MRCRTRTGRWSGRQITELDPVTEMMIPRTTIVPGAADRAAGARASRRFRILTLAPTSFFADYGCHVRIYEEARALQRRGSDVLICTYPAGRDPSDVRIIRSPGLPGGRQIRVGSSRHKLYLDWFLLLRGLRAGLAYRPDVVHAHLHEGALIGAVISRVCRCPLVFDFQGSLTAEMIDHGFLSPRSPAYRPLRRLEGVINRLADAIITSSRSAADLLVREFGCSPRRIVPVLDGVDTEVFRPLWAWGEEERARIRAELGIPAGRRVVVYLGLLAEYQGSGYLLRAATRVIARRPDVHFLLMGYPGEARYRALAGELGISDRTTFTGRIPYEQAPRYLAAGDVAVAPKVSATEANGKLLNYMAVGLPTVAFDTPVNRDLLGEEGVFAPVADIEGLAERLLEVLDEGERARARGRALRRRAEEHFSWDAAAGKILDIYRRLTD